MVTDFSTKKNTCYFFMEVWKNIFTNISVSFSLWRANDHVSEYEELECMTRCAAVTISFPILNITHAHKHLWQGFSGIPLPGMCTSQSYLDLTP